MGTYVLVIDDDPASNKLVSVLLRGEGYSTRCVASAEDALFVLDQAVPSLIVLDLVLPMMSGLMLAQQLRADARTAKVPILAVTAFNGAEAERVALEAGCSAYVRKPIDPLSFIDLVGFHFGGRWQ